MDTWKTCARPGTCFPQGPTDTQGLERTETPEQVQWEEYTTIIQSMRVPTPLTRRRILQVRRDSVFLSSLYWSLPLPLLPHPHHQSDHGSFHPVADHTPIPTHTTTLSAATHLHGTDAVLQCGVSVAGESVCHGTIPLMGPRVGDRMKTIATLLTHIRFIPTASHHPTLHPALMSPGPFTPPRSRHGYCTLRSREPW